MVVGGGGVVRELRNSGRDWLTGGGVCGVSRVIRGVRS